MSWRSGVHSYSAIACLSATLVGFSSRSSCAGDIASTRDFQDRDSNFSSTATRGSGRTYDVRSDLAAGDSVHSNHFGGGDWTVGGRRGVMEAQWMGGCCDGGERGCVEG